MANLKDETRSNNTGDADVARVDMKFEVVVIPVSDVDRAKEFYASLGWRLDADFPFDNGFRVVQFTPPDSGCSIPVSLPASGASDGRTRVENFQVMRRTHATLKRGTRRRSKDRGRFAGA